jgi:hypothetical protein
LAAEASATRWSSARRERATYSVAGAVAGGALSFGVELSGVALDAFLFPLAPFDEVERESVMYHPLPLNTMPTGWRTFRRLPPHCSHVVRGASEKLCRFSIRSLQSTQV